VMTVAVVPVDVALRMSVVACMVAMAVAEV
jgi:hypothetical protein